MAIRLWKTFLTTSMTDFLAQWVELTTRAPKRALGALLMLTLLLGWVGISNFRVNSNLSDLIAQNAPWRADFDHFEEQFPELVRNAVVVVSGESLKRVEIATEAVLAYLRGRPELFRAVVAPGSEPFFRDHALLYMDEAALDDMTDRLAEAQPWLTAVAEDPSLRGIFRLVGDGAEREAPAAFERVLELLGASAGALREGKDPTIWWSDELFPAEELHYQLIYLKPQSAFSKSLPDAEVMAGLRAMRNTVALPEGVRLQFTGELALQHEEMEAAMEGVALAGWLVLVLLLLVMGIGVRSIKIILATFLMLAVGVVWTTALAMLTVGEFNTLSLVFIVMFFGLAVDFALHFSLRFLEAIHAGEQRVPLALVLSTRSVGRAITLCTVTTSLGFLGFWPTDYAGLGDLGIISALGMGVAWVLTFTFLPAFYVVSGAPRPRDLALRKGDRIVHWLSERRRGVVMALAPVVALSLLGAFQARFDYSVLALKDPATESMQGLRELQREGLSTDYQLVVVGKTFSASESLRALPSVKDVRLPKAWVPTSQEEKLAIIGELEFMLWSALEPQEAVAEPDPQMLRDSARALIARIDQKARSLASPSAMSAALVRLRRELVVMDGASDLDWIRWQEGVIDQLQSELAWLRRAVLVNPVGLEDLPAPVRRRIESSEGEALMVILPEKDIADVQFLTEFIAQVRELAPTATGRPVIEWGVGNIVVGSFKQALLFALLTISVVLLAVLRSVPFTVLILLPLGMTVLLILSFVAWSGLSLNMANILVVPLIFGLGVDNGIHVVDRYLGERNNAQLMFSSTPRAVLLSSLTTIGAFAALSLSPHAGTASIGLLLAVAIGLLLLLTLYLVPALLPSRSRAS